MNKTVLQLEYSSWWIPLLILIAIGLSYWLYSGKKGPWSKEKNTFLLLVRSLSTFLVLFLFLRPSLELITNEILAPTITIALDNSQSITQRGVATADQIWKKITALQAQLEQDGINTSVISFDKNSDSIRFSHKESNLDQLIRKATEYQPSNAHLAATILISDGIYTKGVSPEYKTYKKPIYAVGIGDTVPPKDISISRIAFNKTSYSGNITPLKVEVEQNGFYDQPVTVTLKEAGKVLQEKKLILSNSRQELDFQLNAAEAGLRNIEVYVSPLENEENAQNNQQHAVIDVIDSRKKIVLAASSPHPDIRAIKSSLEQTDTYQVDLFIPSIGKVNLDGPYDAAIFIGESENLLDASKLGSPGKWYILGESDIPLDNVKYLSIQRRSGRPDQVSGAFNSNFSKFSIDDVGVFENYPPINVPYGDYSLSGPAEVLLYQQIGSIKTDKPLMVFFDDSNSKSAVLVGQNIWKWQLQEAAINDNSDQFDAWIVKTIQFLSTNSQKTRFRFEPRKTTFSNSQSIIFDVEQYNDIYERVYGNQISIKISREDSSSTDQVFQFKDAPGRTVFTAPNLPSGTYTYSADVQMGNKTFAEGGIFIVRDVNPEFVNLTADHTLLRKMSQSNNASFAHFNEVEDLLEVIRSKDFKPKIKSDSTFKKLIGEWWYYTIILSLFSAEFILRRYWGGY
ncbi:MAG: hypothetical protein AAF789_05675 [Bacteroidota bacterium]